MSEVPFPLELVVVGTPISAQASAKTRSNWQNTVKSAASRRLHELTDWYSYDERDVAVTILYFLSAKMQGDIDNLVKPILDALVQTVYPDDRCVERLLIQKFEPGISQQFSNVTEQLARSLEMEPPVVYIRIDDHLLWRDFA